MQSPALRYVRANAGLTFRPDANTVLWLPGQDDAYSATIRDRSGQGNDGTIVGATWVRGDKGIWYLFYDGSNDRTTCASVVSVSGAHSVLVWWKRIGDSGGGTGDDYHTLVAFVNGGDQNRLMVLKNGTGVFAQINDGVARTATQTISNVSEWHLVGYVWDETNVYAMVDGAFGTGVAASGTLSSGATVTTQGWYTSVYFIANGYIVLVRILNVGLTASQCLGIYNQERHLFGV